MTLKKRASRKAYYYRNKSKHAAITRNSRFKRQYGITVEEYDRMVDAQGGLCAICEQQPKRLNVDHKHGGDVRALLCNHCNVGIGCLGDDPIRLMRAAAYLDNHSG